MRFSSPQKLFLFSRYLIFCLDILVIYKNGLIRKKMLISNFMTSQPAILIIIFWNFTIFQYRSDSPQVEGNLISSIANLVYELPHELPNKLRRRILGEQEILGKSQIWVGTQPSSQFPFKNLDFANTSSKTRKNRFQTFLFLSSFTGLLHLVPNILSGIV